MSDPSNAWVIVASLGQVAVLPTVFAYWQSEVLRKKVNRLCARTLAVVRLQGVVLKSLLALTPAAVALALGHLLFAGLLALVGISIATLLRLRLQTRWTWSATLSASDHQDEDPSAIQWLPHLAQGSDGSSLIVVDRGASCFATDITQGNRMLYFRVDPTPSNRFWRRSTVIAIAELVFTGGYPRLQFDGEFPFMKAERVRMLSEQGPGDRVIPLYVLDRPRFSHRQQGKADFRFNPAGDRPDGSQAECDILLERVTLIVTPR